MKVCRRIALGIAFLAIACRPVFAADDEALARILTRAYIAHNFVFYCAQYDPTIISRTTGASGNMQQLMLHIRGEVVFGLSESEASTVVVRSADAARAGALLAIRKLYDSNRIEERARLTEWCENSAVPFIQELVAWHDRDHASFDLVIQKAKQK
jgi:hypothetical protein